MPTSVYRPKGPYTLSVCTCYKYGSYVSALTLTMGCVSTLTWYPICGKNARNEKRQINANFPQSTDKILSLYNNCTERVKLIAELCLAVLCFHATRPRIEAGTNFVVGLAWVILRMYNLRNSFKIKI